MISREQKKRVINMIVHLYELSSLYKAHNVTEFEQVYYLLDNNDFFTKYVMMNLILIGENSKGVNKSLERAINRRSLTTLEIKLNSIFKELRLFRNRIAHDYYNIETDEIFDVLFKLHYEYLKSIYGYNK